MKRTSRPLTLVAVLVTAAWLVQAASPAGRPTCLVSNERTGAGLTSLQEAIDAAAAGDTLIVKGTCFGNSTIDKDLTLTGVSNKPFGTATLDGSGFNDSVLTITRGVTAAVNNLLIANGTDTTDPADADVGGIADSGALTLTDSTVSGNTQGMLAVVGSLTLVRTTVSDNSGYGIEGVFSRISLVDSLVSDNTGFGIGADMTNVTVTGSQISRNTDNGLGGVESSLTVNDSTVSGNAGGGISIVVAGLVLNNSVVRDNTNTGPGGGIADHGGGVHLNKSTVSGNTGTYGGGIYIEEFFNPGILILADSTISGNTATIDGGGIFNASSIPITLVGTNIFTNNIPNNCVGAGC